MYTNSFKLRCVYCEGEHYSASYTNIVNPKDRKDLLRKGGRCFVCLRNNHKSKDCTSPKTCPHCHNKNHQSMCEHAKTQDNPRQGVKESKTNNNHVSATSATKNKTVLLHTAQAIASNEADTRSSQVRVLLDNGSQCSCIADSLRLKLELPSVQKESLKLNTFGESRYKTQHNCDVVKLKLKKPGSTASVNIPVLSFSVICSPLPTSINMNCSI